MLGKLEDACLGLILGEVATHMDEWTNLTRVPPSACARTFSFAMARALSLHGVRRDGSPVSGAWFRARELTRQPKLRIAEAHMRAPWSAVLSLWADEMPTGEPSAQVAPNLVLDACRDLFSAGAISEPTWKTLVSSLSEMADIRARMGATREERVIHLERAIDVLRRSSLEPETGAFFCGYLTSLVAEGTVEHGGILYPHIQAFPSSLMWYGLCAGLSVRPRLKGHLGGFGRRVLRDLLRLESPLDSPTCDIALTELEVLMGAGASVVDLRTAVQGYMLVELAPCVTTALRWPPGDAVQGELLSTAPDDGLRDLLGELHITMGNVISTYRKLSRLVGDDGARYGREQRDRKQRRKRK
ncbi:MAG: hypothetical protein FJ291_14785 [Planctomycetes bacterium]|nr:hypothetical protein [Planctomycetota bacterium]